MSAPRGDAFAGAAKPPPPVERPLARGEQPPAPLGGWGRMYAFVLVVLLIDIVLLGWLTGRYR